MKWQKQKPHSRTVNEPKIVTKLTTAEDVESEEDNGGETKGNRVLPHTDKTVA